MNTPNHLEDHLSGITWESEVDSALPLHEKDIHLTQMAIQSRITNYSLVDRDADWSDIPFKSPLVSSKIQSLKVGPEKSNGEFKYSEVEGISVKQSKKEQLKHFDSQNFFRYLDSIIRLVGVIIEFIFTIVLYILGVKKIRRTRRSKRVVKSKSPKRRARAASKNTRTAKKTTISSKPRAQASDWKKVDAPFVPSSNLYCYWCTKKLGLKSWELEGHYYCDSCHSSKNVNLR